MTNVQPLVRVLLTFAVAALATLVAMVDDQTIRLICAPLIAGLSAIGITPPQVPTRTVVEPGREPVNVIHDEGGYGLIELAVGLLILVVAVILLLRLVA